MKKTLYTIVYTLFLTSYVYAQETEVALNKKLVTEFVTKVLFHGDAKAIDTYIGDVYTQHNPNLADGKEALREFVKSFPPRAKEAGPSGEIVRIVAEGDLVVLHSKSYGWPQPNGGAIVDIFMVKEGKIVEHWDVIQAIPETSKNKNTMF